MELILDILLHPVVIALLKIVVIVLVFVMLTGTVMTLMERKWMSAVQDRIGPNRANIPFLRNFRGRGMLHMAADGLKSIFKEDTVPAGVDTFKASFELKRWINMAALGWYSSDHHIHSAGCSHYESPSEGVDPVHIWRQLLGENLNFGGALTWGPSWYHQKQFFTGNQGEHE